VNNLTTFAVDKNLMKKTAENILAGEKAKKKDISIVLLSPAKMKSLNWKYRHKNRTTDVLTFPDLDIVICPQVVKDNARKEDLPFKQELVKVVIHGVLHFLGYEHEGTAEEARKMRGKEEKYLKDIGFNFKFQSSNVKSNPKLKCQKFGF